MAAPKTVRDDVSGSDWKKLPSYSSASASASGPSDAMIEWLEKKGDVAAGGRENPLYFYI